MLTKVYYLIVTAMLLTSMNAKAEQYQIDHLEPLSWWTKMQSNTLQLMVHGKNIAQLQAKINHPDIQISQVHRTENNNYLFIDLVLNEHLSPGSYDIDFYLEGNKVLSKSYRFNARNSAPLADTSYSAKDVIYLIMPDRFANGDPSNDSQAQLTDKLNRDDVNGRHGGDIQGIIDHLDYLKNMGFSQIWTTPMVVNNQDDHSYHGYASADFYHIDPRFGSNALYQTLSKRAQEKGIGLIKDVVLNHIGSGHWWMSDLPSDDWLHFQNKAFVGTNHKRESLRDPHATQHDKTLFSNGWFVPSMPDLNQSNPLVSTYLIQNTLWWIEYANLTGLRVDTYSYSDRDFLTRWTRAITAQYPNINIVGEEWATNPAVTSYWQRGKTNHDGYISYLPSVMDFPLQEALVNALKNKESWNTGLNQLYQALANDYQYADPYNLVTFADNHDMSRIYTQLDENLPLVKMAMSIIFTTRGIPQVFYGTELAKSNPGTDAHGVLRSDFPGGWPNDKQNAFSGENLTSLQQQVQSFVKQLLNWRKNAVAIHQGRLIHYAPENGIYVYGRLLADNTEGNDVMVIVNKNSQAMTLKGQDYAEIIGKHTHATEVLSNKRYLLTDKIVVDGTSALILELNE